MNKKVLAIIDSINPYGKERANIMVYNILKNNGFHVQVAYNMNASQNLLNEIGSFEKISLPLPKKYNERSRYIDKIISLAKSNYILKKHIKKESPDYILVPTEIAFSFLFFAIFFSKSKLVFRMGDDPISHRFTNSLPLSIYKYFWKNVILKRVNTVVCNANYIMSNLISSGRNSLSRNYVIYNYPPKRNKNTLSNLDLVNIDRKSLNLGFIGRIVEEKGIELLIKSVIELTSLGHNVNLLIAGNYNRDIKYYSKLRDLIEYNNSTSNVLFLGEIQNTDEFYHSIDVLCMTSTYNEPSANVVVEAKSFKKPTILFNVGGTPELINHLKDGFICEYVNQESLTTAISFYLNKETAFLHGIEAFKSIDSMGIDYRSFETKWLTVFDN